TGILDVLGAMGAEVRAAATPALGTARAGRRGPSPATPGDAHSEGEPLADLTVRPGRLRGTTIAGPLVPRAIDELPVLAVAAAVADGVTELRDAAELRVKESDRVRAVAVELTKMGVAIEERPDGLRVVGSAGRPLRGARVASWGDHRLAMA